MSKEPVSFADIIKDVTKFSKSIQEAIDQHHFITKKTPTIETDEPITIAKEKNGKPKNRPQRDHN